jgi:sulfite oxidase
LNTREPLLTAKRLILDREGLNTAVWPIPPQDFLTPVDRFFTRSHAPVPAIDAASWRLRVDGLVHQTRSIALEELASALPQRSVTATLVCAGLRRQEFLDLGPLPGELPWGPEPVSTGVWTGVGLRELLLAVGMAEDARYVEFTGLDQVERQGQRFGFGGSIDLAKAMEDGVLLATHLHGAPLLPAHGFPLRAVVPGWIGARSVKWLGRITLRPDPSPNYFQSNAYRVQRQINPADPRDVSSGAALSEVPLNAVILDPTPDQVLKAGRVSVRGWAMGSAGRPITEVELSANNGADWVPTRIAVTGRPGIWSFWAAALELRPGAHTLVVRATDTSGARQPAALESTWNVKGYSNNAWHRVAVRVE